MYEELIMRLLEDKSWIEQGTTETEHEIADHLQKAADAIEELTDRNVGKWIPVKEETGVEAFGFKEMTVNAFCCSACGKEVDVSEGDFNFCPFCGSKMIGGDENAL